MTVSSTTSRNDYSGSASLIYSYNFRILSASDLLVYVSGVLKTITTDYTVSGVGNVGGGNVTFVASVNGLPIVFVRVMAETQTTDYVANDPFPADTLETNLDKLTLLVQQLEEEVGRAPKCPITYVSKPSLSPVAFSTLPIASAVNVGLIATVNDSTVNTWGSTVTGGGAFTVLAFSNGANWTVMGA